MKTLDYSLYLVTDGREDLTSLLNEAVLGGVSIVQLRNKSADPKSLKSQAFELKKLLATYQIPLILNDHVEIVKELDLDGVHIGQGDMSYEQARKILGPDKIIGLSVENLEQAAIAEGYDLDYLGVSPLFATQSKKDLSVPWDLDGLARLRKLSKHVLIPIGGIHKANAEEVIRTGANGIAVLSAICSHNDPRLAAKELRDSIAKGRRSKVPPRVLSIACSDSGGGAGVEADLKSISAVGAYAMTCYTSLSAQNTHSVNGFFEVPPQFVRSQIDTVIEDIGVDAVKIGVVYNPQTARIIGEAIQEYKIEKVVLDPVMLSKGGHLFLAEESILALKEHLFPRAFLITPNLPEAAKLLGQKEINERNIDEAAEELLAMGPKAVLIKGGHDDGPLACDRLYFYKNGKLCIRSYQNLRLYTKNTHGTGCSFASAIASYLAMGFDLETAVQKAKEFISSAIEHGQFYKIGSGHGPVDHFFALHGSKK